MKGDLDTLAGRLDWAIQRQPRDGRKRGLRLFQRRLDAFAKAEKKEGRPTPDGTSLSSIQTYVNGQLTPTLGFLKAAAEVLAVREAWLISGDGHRTEEEKLAGGNSGLALIGDARTRQRQIEEAFQKGAEVELPLREWVRETPRPALQVLLRLWQLRCSQVWPNAERRRVRVELARQLGRAVVAPLWAMGIDPTDLNDDVLEDHILAMAPVLRRVIEEHGRRKEANEETGGDE